MSALQIACPSCGASVFFRAQHTLYAACPSCRALLIRRDAVVEKIGEAGEIFPDDSILQIGSQGSYRGTSFYIVGRMQVELIDENNKTVGYWSEWCAHFSDGKLGWVGEAQGDYFVSFARPLKETPPTPLPGDPFVFENHHFVVTSQSKAHVSGFEGELPFVSRQGYTLFFADLSSGSSNGATLDISDSDEPILYLGEWCKFEELNWTNLASGEPSGDGLNLPNQNVKKITCRGCGASLEIKLQGLSQSLACEYCGGITDALNEDYYRIFSEQQAKDKLPATLKLGLKMTLPMEPKAEFEVIGNLQKEVVVDGLTYKWFEYLLFNRLAGFRWLVETEGHWIFMRGCRQIPTNSKGVPYGDPVESPVVFKGRVYDHFQTSKPSVELAAGEFYWKIRRGYKVVCRDYICPPYILSVEISDEINWTEGEYVPHQVIAEAAKLSELRQPSGVASCQTNPYDASNSKNWKAFALLGLGGFLGLNLVGHLSRTPVFDQSIAYRRYDKERSKIFPVTLDGRTRNLQLEVEADHQFDNRWAFFQLTLINEETKSGLDCGVQLDRTERGGVRKGHSLLPAVAPGKYLLRVEPQTGVGEVPEANGTEPPAGQESPIVFNYNVRIRRDVPQWGFYWAFLFAIGLPPLWWSYRASNFETRRWSESDHAEDAGDDDE